MTIARYDDVADFYSSGWRDVYDDEVSLALFDLLEPVTDLSVLDLACGHGRVSREIARRGGRVVGVDLSEKLIDKARAIDANEPLGISYFKADAASGSILQDQVFDAVVSSFGLSDIDDLDGALATVARVLVPGADSSFRFYIHVLAAGRTYPVPGRPPGATMMKAGGRPMVRSPVSVDRLAPTTAGCRRTSTACAPTVW